MSVFAILGYFFVVMVENRYSMKLVAPWPTMLQDVWSYLVIPGNTRLGAALFFGLIADHQLQFRAAQ